MSLQQNLNTFSEFQIGHVYAIAKLMNCKVLQRKGDKPILVVARRGDSLPILKWVFGEEPKILDMEQNTFIPLMTSDGRRYTIAEWVRSLNGDDDDD